MLFITVYTTNERGMLKAAILLREQYGLMLRVKAVDELNNEMYLFQTDLFFSVMDLKEKKEYIDVKLSFSGRLEPFLHLPLYDVLCIPALAEETQRLLKTGEVKIVGIISK